MNSLHPEVIAYFSAIGKKGGSVKGASKARTREQAQRAVNARWERYRLTRQAGALGSAESATSANAIKINLEKPS